MSRARTKVAYTRLENEITAAPRFISGDWETLNLSSTTPAAENGDALELRSRARPPESKTGEDDSIWLPSSSGGLMLIDRQIQEGDTLQKIALQYSVKVSELKRVNGLMSDQDLYARKVLKIPLSRLSSAADLQKLDTKPSSSEQKLVDIDSSEASSDKMLPLSDNEDISAEGPSRQPRVNSANKSPSGNQSANKELKKMLREVDKSLEKAKQDQAARQQGDHIFNADIGDGTHFYEAVSPRNGFWVRNIGHYVAVLLCIFFFVVIPVSYVLYEVVDQLLKGHGDAPKPTGSH